MCSLLPCTSSGFSILIIVTSVMKLIGELR
jgi:hypothetical protein